ncbi:calcium-binding protein (plasmid) [Octadecabacter sp. SW4]|uniref:calcium-binding protein n=1 Tax=Octadecabacter sp. SW4 TaxID=2602067 RepID=UPI0011C1E0BB|nr:calcium-binding protein [Octadecabacter sp. SW4]QEE37563.1 calcium-binding protein [Octadecabacter sp. SW4]
MSTVAQITIEENSGVFVTEDHFGLNHVFEFEAIGDKPWEKFDDLIEFTGLKTIRYPGGVSAETIFDITNPNASTYIDENGQTKSLTPLNDFLSFASDVDAQAIIVIPVARLLTDDMPYGQRAFDLQHAEAIRSFVLEVLETSFPNPISAFELGNEYEGYMTAAEYGKLSGDIATIVDEVIEQFYNNNTTYSGLEQPGILIQSWVQSVTGLTSVDELLERAQNQLNEYSIDELSVIDGIVGHFYFRDELLSGQDGTNTFNNLVSAIEDSVGIMGFWEDASGVDLDLMISEWNVLHKSYESHGLEQAGLMLEMFNTFLVNGVDMLSFWSAQYHPTSIANAAGDIMVAGEVFASLTENTLGDAVLTVSGLPDGIRAQAFSGETDLDMYVSSIDEGGWNGELDLSAFGTPLRLLSAQVLSVDTSNADGEYGSQAGLAYWNEPDLTPTWTDISFEQILDGSILGFPLSPYEVLHVKFEIANEVVGEADQVELFGTAGWDLILGNDLDNRLVGHGGGDEFFGGAGKDMVSYQTVSQGIVADIMGLNNNAGAAAMDVYHSIESLEGSEFSDQLFGNHASNYLVGGAGSDKINGRNGNDVLDGGDGWDFLVGGKGADHIIGGNGVDTAAYQTAYWRVIVDLVNQSTNIGDAKGDLLVGIENILGSKYNDVLRGGGDANKLSGGQGDDKLNGRQGDDRLFGGSGDDILLGGDGADLLSGGSGSDTAAYWTAWSGITADLSNATRNTGNAAGDTFVSIENLIGSNFTDQLYGNALDNEISGRAGADTLHGRGGNDTLSGGVGADTFVFMKGDDHDVVSDFGLGADRIQLDQNLTNDSNLTSAELIETFGTLEDYGQSLTLDFGDGDAIQILGVAGFDFLATESWFEIV